MDAHARLRVAGSRSHLWSVGQRSETGYVRSENQDRMSWIRASVADVFVVSDGMGGHAGGAVAAMITVEVLQDELQALDSLTQADDVLAHALQAANATVHARGQTADPAVAGMGATAVVLLAAGKRIMVAHVGDSRAYRLDRRGGLHRLTKDHSVVQRMVDAGTLTTHEARHHPDASVLERALGQSPRVSVEVSAWIAVRRGELCMLCSDGLCGYVDDDAIASEMQAGGAPQAIADRLVRLALDAGGEDNVTVQVLLCGSTHSAHWRRWIGRGALALASLCAAGAALVWAGWLGLRDDAASGAAKASRPAGSRAVAKEASAVNPPLAASVPGASNAAVAAEAAQPAATTRDASASVAASDTPTLKTPPDTARHAGGASAPKHRAKHAHRTAPKALVQAPPASAADAADDSGDKPQSADSDNRPVEVKQ